MEQKPIDSLRVKIFADGAEKDGMIALAQKPYIKGLTTNPSLLRKAGVVDYVQFAKEITPQLEGKPVSFEVFANDFDGMEREARIITTWGENVYVKIPVINTNGESSAALVNKLSNDGIKLNVTAIYKPEQVREITDALSPNVPAIISVFAGRAADVGIDPLPIMKACKEITAQKPNVELLWASSREVYNIYEAEELQIDIITVAHDILKKLDRVGMSLDQLTLETVQIFAKDIAEVGYKID